MHSEQMRMSSAAFARTMFRSLRQNEQPPMTSTWGERLIAVFTHASQIDTPGPSARYTVSVPQKLHTIALTRFPVRRKLRRNSVYQSIVIVLCLDGEDLVCA